jgi:hypothetical protein
MAIVGERKRKKKTHTSHAVPAYSDDHWEKNEDVRALGRAAAIHADPERHKRAIKHAATMREEHANRMAESKAIVKLADKGK